ncbi:MAG: VWA domain-containing protein [Rhodobacteraceae bacterium]|nr:VWA domain-containing protein [Paracoccaceae bacterium]
MASHSRRSQRALAHLAETDPAVAALGLWCVHRDGPAATHTQGDTIWYGPEFETLPISVAVGVTAHHILHVAFRHSARKNDMQERHGALFNEELFVLAADALLNDLLLVAGHALPRPAVRASELLTAATGQPITAEKALQDWDSDRLYHAILGTGSGKTGTNSSVEEYAQSKGFEPDLRAQSGAQDDEAVQQEWQGRITRAMEAGHLAGTGIGSVGIALPDLNAPSVPWEVLLRRLLTKAVLRVPRRTYQRPANRWIAMESLAQGTREPDPPFEPGSRRDEVQPRIVVAVDASSSITRQTLEFFAAEVVGLNRRLPCELHLLIFDDHVTGRLTPVRTDLRSELRTLAFHEGGGTDFAPVLEEAAALNPSAVVVLTDLEGPFGRAINCPVIWLTQSAPCASPPFGQVIVADT